MRKQFHTLSHVWFCHIDKSAYICLEKQLNEETSEEVLTNFIFEKKKELSEKEFYYLAGRATQCTIDEADEMGIDSLNAAAGGIDMFEELIGIEESEEND